MRLIHTADWQLAKPFGRMPPAVRTLLGEARLDAIDTLAAAARAHGAAHVLVAGDVFDCAEPGDAVLRRAVAKMAAAPDVRWWLLPGNHDPVRADGLWSRLTRNPPPNVRALLSPDPVELDPGVWLLPAPLSHRHVLADPTAAFDGAGTPAGARRIGLAHGSVQGFGSAGEDGPNRLPPDRARRSGLDYLALGDWHGQLRIDERTWYSGTPEPDSFKENDNGRALLVELSGPGAAPAVTPLPVGRYAWASRSWRLDAPADLDREIARLRAETGDMGRLLLQLSVSGLMPLTDRVEILDRIRNELAHEVRWLEVDDRGLQAAPTEDDLAAIDAGGVLREAADRLRALSQAEGPEGRRAAAALERLLVTHRNLSRAAEVA